MSLAILEPIGDGASTSAAHLRLGYIPLIDSAPLLVADEMGLFRRHGVRVALSEATSWAGLRDRVMHGALDGAQMLAPMPIASALGLGGMSAEFAVTAATGRNGNTITLGGPLAEDVAHNTLPLSARRFAEALEHRRARGTRPAVLAVVFAFSSHNYLLRDWLASGGIDPDHDVQLVVVPPPLVAEQLASGDIDGFCAGEPWGSCAVDVRVGRIVLETADIRRDHSEKMLAFRASSIKDDRGLVAAATAAVVDALQWLAEPSNVQTAARLLHEQALQNVPLEIIARSIAGRSIRAPDGPTVPTAPMWLSRDLTMPNADEGDWWFTQMQRWGHVSDDAESPVSRLWRADVWHEAMAMADAVAPVVA